MMRLYSNNGINEQMMEDLQFIDALITDLNIQSRIVPQVLNLGLVELCQHLCRKMFTYRKPFDGTDKGVHDGIAAASTCLSCVVDMTDMSKHACHRVVDVGLHEDIFRFLKLDSMDPSKVTFCGVRYKFACLLISVAYNVIQASQFGCFFLCQAVRRY